MRGRNELVDTMLGRVRAAMNRRVGVRTKSALMRLAARQALEGIIFWMVEIKAELPFQIGREAFGHWRESF